MIAGRHGWLAGDPFNALEFRAEHGITRAKEPLAFKGLNNNDIPPTTPHSIYISTLYIIGIA